MKKALFKIRACILLLSREIQEIMENPGEVNLLK